MSTANALRLDSWIRGEFRELNTELENAYFQREDRADVTQIGDEAKLEILARGGELVAALLAEGNTDEGFEAGFSLLGDVGLFMAACRRHEIDDPPMRAAHALAMQLGASLGVAPRFASAHLETHNRAVDGTYKTFTTLEAERLFLDYNTRGALGYIRAAEALRHCIPLGVSHPVAADMLRAAAEALRDVWASNAELFESLDVDRFFYSVRPYYKPHQVGLREYRGANAGDFAGINVIDLLLGLCRADSPYYSQILVDKFLFMRPDDQLVLRDCMRLPSLMDEFLAALPKYRDRDWFQRNLKLFLEVCDLHGQTAVQHHEQLVARFIEAPAGRDAMSSRADLTASGPPLPVLLDALQKLADLRAARPRVDMLTRHDDVMRLREALQ
ncbi:MAG: monodechloroaminopyrrolnitrin synthase PrnB family protein [Halieaceae bacterium]|nr:monodechloroaminopyrrolnitrin synthase PrnB family protein [Halieaceae bacterium]